MKHYPSIIRIDPIEGHDREYYSWDKLDGSCIRCEYSHKTGWFKFGSRKQLIDAKDPVLGPAIPLFNATLAEPLTKVMRDNKWINATVFCEYHGPNSLAGRHKPGDKMDITLFDVAIYKQGLMPSRDFLRHFEHVNIPRFLGVHVWDRAFVERIRHSELDGISMEGAVGKPENGYPYMVKCKTHKWLSAIRQRYSEEEARGIIES